MGIVGGGRTSGRTKASAVLEVAANLAALHPPVHTDADYDHANPEHRAAYRSVSGLGEAVTHLDHAVWLAERARNGVGATRTAGD